MKLLIIDNLAVARSRRQLYKALANKIEDKLHLLVPEIWKEQGVIINCEEEDDQKLILHKSKFLFGYRHQRIIYLDLKKVLKQIQPEIVFINSEPENFNTFHLVKLIRKYFPDTKIACATWRNIDYRNNPYPYKFGFLNRWIELYTRKYINLCIAHSPTAVKLMPQISNWKVTFIPPAIDLIKFKFKSFNSAKDSFVLGYIGRLVFEKGVDILLKAIPNTNSKVRCIIVGDGPEKNKLQKLSRSLNIEDRISWKTAVKYEEIPSIFQLIDVLVLPSRTTKKWKEQFGRVIIEAMASGVLVVGSNTGDIPNVIQNYGFLFEEEDFMGLAKIINKLCKGNFYDELLINARKMVEENYSIETVAEKMYNLFKNLSNE